jgi:hypothetical protein
VEVYRCLGPSSYFPIEEPHAIRSREKTLLDLKFFDLNLSLLARLGAGRQENTNCDRKNGPD